MKLNLNIKQKFCKHRIKEHIATEIREYKPFNRMGVSKKDTYEIYKCSKCGKIEMIHIPHFTSIFKNNYDNYVCSKYE